MCSDLILVSFRVLDSLETDGHDSEWWRWEIFDDCD